MLRQKMMARLVMTMTRMAGMTRKRMREVVWLRTESEAGSVMSHSPLPTVLVTVHLILVGWRSEVEVEEEEEEEVESSVMTE